VEFSLLAVRESQVASADSKGSQGCSCAWSTVGSIRSTRRVALRTHVLRVDAAGRINDVPCLKPYAWAELEIRWTSRRHGSA